MKIAIAGKKEQTGNYVKYLESMGVIPVVTLLPSQISTCQGLLLPGGGDITPAFYGEQNHGSHSIDTELDILQLQAFDLAMDNIMPVLGICKGLQIINVGLGGSLIQDLEPPVSDRHQYHRGDKYHDSVINSDSWLYKLYGHGAIVNSAHHQAIDRLGRGLSAVSCCPLDGCIEAIAHESLPIIGVQWHPERIDFAKSSTDGKKVLEWFLQMLSG